MLPERQHIPVLFFEVSLPWQNQLILRKAALQFIEAFNARACVLSLLYHRIHPTDCR